MKSMILIERGNKQIVFYVNKEDWLSFDLHMLSLIEDVEVYDKTVQLDHEKNLEEFI